MIVTNEEMKKTHAMKKTETTKNKRRNRNWAKYLDCQRVRERNKNGVFLCQM